MADIDADARLAHGRASGSRGALGVSGWGMGSPVGRFGACLRLAGDLGAGLWLGQRDADALERLSR